MNRYEAFIIALREYAKDRRRSRLTQSLLGQAADYIQALFEGRVVRGRWIVDRGREHTQAVCSECGASYYYFNKGQYQIDKSNFCPNCGADMRPEEHDEAADEA
jgi:DNA-directed RNA polymerase subunit RPC12/RpoP